jgi:hypothetical protein
VLQPPRPGPGAGSHGWPDTAVVGDAAAESAREVALALRTLVVERGLAHAAGLLGVRRSAVADVIVGSAWPTPELVLRLQRLVDRR